MVGWRRRLGADLGRGRTVRGWCCLPRRDSAGGETDGRALPSCFRAGTGGLPDPFCGFVPRVGSVGPEVYAVQLRHWRPLVVGLEDGVVNGDVPHDTAVQVDLC